MASGIPPKWICFAGYPGYPLPAFDMFWCSLLYPWAEEKKKKPKDGLCSATTAESGLGRASTDSLKWAWDLQFTVYVCI